MWQRLASTMPASWLSGIQPTTPSHLTSRRTHPVLCRVLDVWSRWFSTAAAALLRSSAAPSTAPRNSSSERRERMSKAALWCPLVQFRAVSFGTYLPVIPPGDGDAIGRCRQVHEVGEVDGTTGPFRFHSRFVWWVVALKAERLNIHLYFLTPDASIWVHLFNSFTKFYSPMVFKERDRREVNSQTKYKARKIKTFCNNSLLTT